MRVRAKLRGLWRGLRPAPAILMYHRIASPEVDPWSLAVSPAAFDDQLRALKANRTVLSMTAFVERLGQGALPANAVALTFDDGYVDNLTAACPALERHTIPATVFVTTGTIGGGREFWWDALARLILEREEPIDTTVSIGGKPLNIALPARHGRSAADRAAYEKIWSLMQAAEAGERDGALSQLAGAVRAPAVRPGDLPMDADQLALLAANDLVEVGAHGVSHARLNALTSQDQRREIEESRDACAAMIGRRVTGFAYPFGAVGAETASLARQAGFSYACTTRSACVRTDDDAFNLPRVAAADESGEALLRRLAEA